MRYVFIVNPKAGKQNAAEVVLPRVQQFFQERQLPFIAHLTQGPGHATALARAEAEKGDPVRIVAVGGDGTLCETANGIIGMDHASVGVLPCGSGNDYLKLFGTHADFVDLDRLLRATPYKVDMIQSRDMSALNICSAGLDASVAMNMVRYKKCLWFPEPWRMILRCSRPFSGRSVMKCGLKWTAKPWPRARFC